MGLTPFCVYNVQYFFVFVNLFYAILTFLTKRFAQMQQNAQNVFRAPLHCRRRQRPPSRWSIRRSGAGRAQWQYFLNVVKTTSFCTFWCHIGAMQRAPKGTEIPKKRNTNACAALCQRTAPATEPSLLPQSIPSPTGQSAGLEWKYSKITEVFQ